MVFFESVGSCFAGLICHRRQCSKRPRTVFRLPAWALLLAAAVNPLVASLLQLIVCVCDSSAIFGVDESVVIVADAVQ